MPTDTCPDRDPALPGIYPKDHLAGATAGREGLHLSVLGKAAGRRLLRTLAHSEPGLDAARLRGLIAGADRPAAELDQLRLDTAEGSQAR